MQNLAKMKFNHSIICLFVSPIELELFNLKSFLLQIRMDLSFKAVSFRGGISQRTPQFANI